MVDERKCAILSASKCQDILFNVSPRYRKKSSKKSKKYRIIFNSELPPMGRLSAHNDEHQQKYALKYVFDANLNHRKEVLCKSLPSTSATAVWQKLYLEIY